MAKKKKRGPGRPRKEEVEEDEIESIGLSQATKKGLWLLVLLGLILLVILSFLGFAGKLGLMVDKYLSLGIGWGRLVVPFVLGAVFYQLVKADVLEIEDKTKFIGLFLIWLGLTGAFHSFIPTDQMRLAAKEGRGGGFIGFYMAFYLQKYVGFSLTIFILFALVLAGLLVYFNLPLSILFSGMFKSVKEKWEAEKEAVMEEDEEDDDEDEEDEEGYEEEEEMEDEEMQEEVEGEEDEEDDEEEEKPKRRRKRKVKIPLELLDTRGTDPDSGDIDANQQIIEETLENFNIPVEMGDVNIGPTVTQYTLKPARGIKLTKIMALNNDLALALAAHPIRIEAPIPGKSAIGIEVPNKSAATIGLKDLLTSKEYRKSKKKYSLRLPLGVDVAGDSFVVGLEKMPHLLIAGATGSGKSVAVNGMIVSMLYQYGPDELKFIMVDPKRVELPVYNRIPHLLTPVITDVKKTINALKWLVVEMDRRYTELATKGKRNLASYNEVAEEPMPYIVLVIDELADLMIVAANEVETYIIRLAQMARAVGIHLMLATQRPSVDVITGLLKANIPGRIAFSVASAVDSRTILDAYGAEKLVGRGDMLFSSAEVSKPKRMQGPYVSEYEVKRVVSFLADEIGEPEYIEEVVENQKTPTAFVGGGDDDGDELFEEAKELVVEAQKASTSYLQRKLRVGYARAARLMDLLEDAGVVSEQQGSKGRDVLISKEDNDTIQEEMDEEPDFEAEEDDDYEEDYDQDYEEDEEDDDDEE